MFLDEGGNFDFSPNGSKWFSLTSVIQFRPFEFDAKLCALKFDLLEEGLCLDRFHATEDMQHVRDKVFDIIKSGLSSTRIDHLLIEKCKTNPSIRHVEEFYPKMLCYLLKYPLAVMDWKVVKEVIVITDSLPVQKKRQAIEKAVKMSLKAALPPDAKYRIYHWDSRSCFGIQLADYCNWATYIKWERGETRSYDLIKSAIRSEFDIFKLGAKTYY